MYGREGHRQRESFNDSYKYDFSRNGKIRIIEVDCFDKTNTNDYVIVRITRDSYEDCERELDGQISDGIFENCRVGLVEEMTPEYCIKAHRYRVDGTYQWRAEFEADGSIYERVLKQCKKGFYVVYKNKRLWIKEFI